MMKKISRIFVIFLLIFSIFYLLKSDFKFYYVNFYSKNGLDKQELFWGNIENYLKKVDKEVYSISFDDYQINLYQNYKIVVVVDNRVDYVMTNFSENFNDVLKKLNLNNKKGIVCKVYKNGIYRSIKLKKHNISSFFAENIFFYTPKDVVFVFMGKEYHIPVYNFMSYKDIENIIKKEVLGMIKGNIRQNNFVLKNIDLFEISDSFLVSFDSYFPKKVGVNLEGIKKVERKIPFGRKVVYTTKLSQGESRIVNKGKNGRRIDFYRVVLDFEGNIENEFIGSRVIEDAVDEVVQVGIAPITSLDNKRYFIMESTGYTSGVDNVGMYTCIGLKVRRGIIAVDPSIIPLGTRVYVEGYGYAVAADVGSAIKGFRIDLYFESYDEAIRWGRRKVKVFIF